MNSSVYPTHIMWNFVLIPNLKSVFLYDVYPACYLRFFIKFFNAILRYIIHFNCIRALSIFVVHTCNWYHWNRLIETFKMNTNNLYPKWIFIICYLLFWTSKLKNLSIREQRKVSKRVNFWIFQEKTPWSNAYVSQIKYST